jgi:hypothetical protein
MEIFFLENFYNYLNRIFTWFSYVPLEVGSHKISTVYFSVQKSPQRPSWLSASRFLGSKFKERDLAAQAARGHKLCGEAGQALLWAKKRVSATSSVGGQSQGAGDDRRPPPRRVHAVPVPDGPKIKFSGGGECIVRCRRWFAVTGSAAAAALNNDKSRISGK